MKKTFLIFLVFSLFIKVVQGDDKIYFNFDYALFQGDNNQSILEIYYSVSQRSLKYTEVQNNFEAAAKIDISIIDVLSNKVVSSNIYKTPSIVKDTSEEILKQKLVGQVNYILPNGSYLIQITGSDFNDSSRKDTHEETITVESSHANVIKLSDIELSTFIQKAKNEKSIFYKNTLEVIPNPSNLFGMNLKDLFYYFEIYGLSPDNISDKYVLQYSITNLNNEPIVSHRKEVNRTAESKADYGKLKVDSLKRGSYLFKISIVDSLKNVSVSKEKKFFIFNSSDNVAISTGREDYLRSEYNAMPESAINDEFNKLQYILTEQETDKFESLRALDDKRKYLYSFWKLKDINPETPNFESKIAYFKKIKEANNSFKEAFKEGWKTDRGRIFIIYGNPDDIERFPFEAGTKSYEIWKYNSVEGGGECVFVERQPGTDVYWLIHSTFRNELKNSDWRRELNQ